MVKKENELIPTRAKSSKAKIPLQTNAWTF
jgi:hypothetical protein